MDIELLSGERQSNETDKAVQSCNDWLRMGPGRSLVDLLKQYTDGYSGVPPTTVYQTLKNWSKKFDWPKRASDYDATWEQRKNAERERVFNEGLALDYERVRKLRELAIFLEGQLYERGTDGNYHNIWIPDVKQIGQGEFAERVDIERFNASIIDQYRATLDDIAKETNGRIKRTEITGANGGKIEVETTVKGALDKIYAGND